MAALGLLIKPLGLPWRGNGWSFIPPLGLTTFAVVLPLPPQNSALLLGHRPLVLEIAPEARRAVSMSGPAAVWGSNSEIALPSLSA
jgi:hypothetical protein